jgi:hypothetical protein
MTPAPSEDSGHF